MFSCSGEYTFNATISQVTGSEHEYTMYKYGILGIIVAILMSASYCKLQQIKIKENPVLFEYM